MDHPEDMLLANNKYYTLAIVLIIYWLATFISLKGLSWVGKVAKIGGMVGTIIPAALLIILGIVYLATGGHSNMGSNLIGMGVLPLQFPAGESYESLGLNGTETYDIAGVEKLNEGVTPKTVHVTATHEDGSKTEFDAVVRIDTPGEADYYRNGGILQYVLRNLMK